MTRSNVYKRDLGPIPPPLTRLSPWDLVGIVLWGGLLAWAVIGLVWGYWPFVR